MTQIYQQYSEKELLGIAKKEVEKQGKTFVYDKEFKELFHLLYLYFTHSKEFENYSFKSSKGNIPYSHSKGLFIFGKTGRGKTFLMENIFFEFAKETESSRRFLKTTSEAIENKFLDEGAKAFKTITTQHHLTSYFDKNGIKKSFNNFVFIDELGIEEYELNDYGTKFKPMVKFLNYRYQQFVKFNTKTFITSNFNLKQINEKYKERIYSRFFEMFNFISVSGNDLRINLK